MGGILASDGVLGYDEEVWGDEGNRRRLLGALGAHADELRVWARDAGVTLPGPEPDAPAGESGVFCQIFVGRFGVSFSPFERLFLGRFGFGQSCGLSVIA